MRADMTLGAACRPHSHKQVCAPLRGVKGPLRQAAPALDTAPAARPPAPAVSHPGIDSHALILLSRVNSQPLNNARHSARKSPRQLRLSFSQPAVLKDRNRNLPIFRETKDACFPLDSGGHNTWTTTHRAMPARS